MPDVRKPDPRHPLYVVDALGVASGASVMVGDSQNDIGAAKAAGMPTVAVTFGYAHCPIGELGADALIDHFDELVPAITKIAG